MKDAGLADRLRTWLEPAGFQVVEVDGWQDRGRTYATFNPTGSVNHHTAGALGSDAPSLGICINGRSDLPGPLCNVFGSRGLVAYVVAAGIANHAGPGSYNGLAGNYTVHGLELENVGSDAEPRTERQSDFAARIHCAFLTAPGSSNDPAHTCQHFEWSTMGKIDFWHWAGDDLRTRVATLLANGPGAVPKATPKPSGLVKAQWFYKNTASDGVADGQFGYGMPGDRALVGDWDGDGVDGPGVVRGNVFYLRNSVGEGVADISFAYGDAGDRVIVGDWDGDGRAGVGVVRENVFYLRNTLSSGNAEQVFAFGNPGDLPLVGRWRSGQRESVGVHRGSTIYLRNPDTGVADIVFNYGDAGDVVIMGDWNGDGVDTPAIVRNGQVYLRNSNTTGVADQVFGFGDPGDTVLGGRWIAGAGTDGLIIAR